MMYGVRSNGKKHGLVITKPIVVKKMLDLASYTANADLRSIHIVEPASGDGAFAIEIINRLYQSSREYGFDFEQALVNNVKLFEIDELLCATLKERLLVRLKELGFGLPEGIVQCQDFLTSNFPKADIIVGNPPYVRHENIPQAQKEVYRKQFGTFTHRSDLYIAFFEKGLRHLNSKGYLSFICSNRWLKNQYGKGLRKYISYGYSLLEVINLEGTSPFEEEVIAYPAVINIGSLPKKATANYYHFDQLALLDRFNRQEALGKTLNLNTPDWFSDLKADQGHGQFLETIEGQGFKIGIGVATGCDKLFIRDDFEGLVEKELLLPILTSKDLKGNALHWGGNYIINPFDESGKLIDLELFPRAKSYFNQNKERLKNRYVAKKKPENWYRTIDKIDPSLTLEAKIILPDITGNNHVFIDRGKYYPHHNLYYIKGRDDMSLVVLAALLMSDFTKEQLLLVSNKMNGGYPRWQSQNLRKLKLPIIDIIPDEVKSQLIQAYKKKDLTEINRLVNLKKVSEYQIKKGQMKLFESSS